MIRQATNQKSSKSARKQGVLAFTLIELLVVISIIGVLAALLIPGGAIASRKMKVARVKAELNQLVTWIENYKLEVGEYPPDNGLMRTVTTNITDDVNYTNRSRLHPLYYELSGATFETNSFKVRLSEERVLVNDLKNIFNIGGIRNSARAAADVPYKATQFKASQYKELNAGTDVEVLAVPVVNFPVEMLDGKNNTKINPWKYDSSSPRRHNRNSFDLWADINLGGKPMRISNWSEQ